MKRIGIIGGGLGGLASACTLAARGYSVVLFERNEWLGGKAAVLEQDGFRFDMGPTIVTLPSVLRRIFSEAGRDLDDLVADVLSHHIEPGRIAVAVAGEPHKRACASFAQIALLDHGGDGDTLGLWG